MSGELPASHYLQSDTVNVARCAVSIAIFSIVGCVYIMADTLRVHGSCRRACGCDPRQRALRRRIRQQVLRHQAQQQRAANGSRGAGRTSYGTAGFLPDSESYQPRIVKVPTPTGSPARPLAAAEAAGGDARGRPGSRANSGLGGDDSLHSSLHSSTESTRGSGSVGSHGGGGGSGGRGGGGGGMRGGSFGSGDGLHTTTGFVKQRDFAEKSGPFLLFNLNLSVLLLSAAFIVSGGEVLSSRGNTSRLEHSLLCSLSGAVIYYFSAASMFFMFFFCLATTMYQYGREISKTRHCIGLMVAGCWVLPGALLVLIVSIAPRAVDGHQVYDAWCAINTHVEGDWIVVVTLYVPLVTVLGVCVASSIATAAHSRTLQRRAVKKVICCGEMQLRLYLLSVAFFVARVAIVIDAVVNAHTDRFAVNVTNIDTFDRDYVRSLHGSALFFGVSVPGLGVLLFFAYSIPVWVNGRHRCRPRRRTGRALANTIKAQSMSFNHFKVLDDGGDTVEF